MKFLILNRLLASIFTQSVDHILISICTFEDDFPELPEDNKRMGVLRLSFADTDEKKAEKEQLPITESQAEEILNFVDRYKDKVELIICQCDGGISRSSGIAAALSKILNNDDKWVFNSKRYLPNMYVYRLLLNKYSNK